MYKTLECSTNIFCQQTSWWWEVYKIFFAKLFLRECFQNTLFLTEIFFIFLLFVLTSILGNLQQANLQHLMLSNTILSFSVFKSLKIDEAWVITSKQLEKRLILDWKLCEFRAKINGQVDFTESAESAKNHNFLSLLIKQPKNYL